MEEKQKGSAKKIAIGTLAGAILGVIVGILLAPQKGKKTRKELKKVSEKIAKDIAKKATGVKKLTKERYNRIVDEVLDFYEKAKKIKKEDLKEIVNDLKAKWPQIAQKLKKK